LIGERHEHDPKGLRVDDVDGGLDPVEAEAVGRTPLRLRYGVEPAAQDFHAVTAGVERERRDDRLP
jgi:hypothetical protein